MLLLLNRFLGEIPGATDGPPPSTEEIISCTGTGISPDPFSSDPITNCAAERFARAHEAEG
jgi:hypothetical protein